MRVGAVIVGLVFVLDHCLDLSDGVRKVHRILVDIHAVIIFIFDDQGSEVNNL